MPLVNGLIEPTPFEAAMNAANHARRAMRGSYSAKAWHAYLAAHRALRALQDKH